jgi:hypothetical protein
MHMKLGESLAWQHLCPVGWLPDTVQFECCHGTALIVWCDDPPTLSDELFVLALVFLNRMSVGRARRVVSKIRHTWAQVCPGDKYTFPHRHCCFWLSQFGASLCLVYFGTSQHPSLSPYMHTSTHLHYWLHTPLLVYSLLYLMFFFICALSSSLLRATSQFVTMVTSCSVDKRLNTNNSIIKEILSSESIQPSEDITRWRFLRWLQTVLIHSPCSLIILGRLSTVIIAHCTHKLAKRPLFVCCHEYEMLFTQSSRSLHCIGKLCN